MAEEIFSVGESGRDRDFVNRRIEVKKVFSPRICCPGRRVVVAVLVNFDPWCACVALEAGAATGTFSNVGHDRAANGLWKISFGNHNAPSEAAPRVRGTPATPIKGNRLSSFRGSKDRNRSITAFATSNVFASEVCSRTICIQLANGRA
jgi:hypothetical protein